MTDLKASDVAAEEAEKQAQQSEQRASEAHSVASDEHKKHEESATARAAGMAQ